MNIYLIILNLIFMLIVGFWAFYKAHTSERLINRASFIFIGVSTSLLIIAHIVPEDSDLFYQNYGWQRLTFCAAIAGRALVEFYCEYGSHKWKEAFTNSKERFLHLTRS